MDTRGLQSPQEPKNARLSDVIPDSFTGDGLSDLPMPSV